MKTGWEITCPACGATIDEFELTGEWFCQCGAHGIHEPDED